MTPFRVTHLPTSLAEEVRRTRSDQHGNLDLPITVETGKAPCRHCLQDAAPGEPLLLFSYTPFDRPRPYRTVGPVFIHAGDCPPYQDRGTVPELLRRRRLSLRAYSADDVLLYGEVALGTEIDSLIERFFTTPTVRYIDVHNAGVGCFLCRLVRS